MTGECLTDSAMLKEINARSGEGTDKYKVNSTPSFLINGKLEVGEKDYDSFVALLPSGKSNCLTCGLPPTGSPY